MMPGIYHDLLPEILQSLYLQRYGWQGPILSGKPQKDTEIIVVIPCYNEPNIIESLDSLFACEPPDCSVEIILVINHSEKDSLAIKEFNNNTVDVVENWIKNHQRTGIKFHLIKAFDLPAKSAGVGLARKIGMDEAVRRFQYLNNTRGVIVCFDADCTCSTNYFTEIQKFYQSNPKTNSANIYFEHSLGGRLQKEIYSGIIDYELHLRCYKNALAYAKIPQSFHAIGSCITVTSEAYQKQGGMNKRKAGEDFYFLQKIFQLGKIGNIQAASVYPSPRPSDRVPFGTGKSINDILTNPANDFTTYNPNTFVDLKTFMECVPGFYDINDVGKLLSELPVSINSFLMHINFKEEVAKLKKNSNSISQFLKSFFTWFNGFQALKYVHFARDNFYKDIDVLDAANWILSKVKSQYIPVIDKKSALMYLRKLDRLDQ